MCVVYENRSRTFSSPPCALWSVVPYSSASSPARTICVISDEISLTGPNGRFIRLLKRPSAIATHWRVFLIWLKYCRAKPQLILREVPLEEPDEERMKPHRVLHHVVVQFREQFAQPADRQGADDLAVRVAGQRPRQHR